MNLIIKKSNNIFDKLTILSNDSKYDLACSCATSKDEHRTRSQDNRWIYPVVLPNGGYRYLFKTLLSNICSNNCKYCPLRSGATTSPCELSPLELVKAFLSYYKAGSVSGLFLSSSVRDNPDATMERINTVALMLRRMQFKGYIHLKIIPGASEAAIRQSLKLASAVSLNIETPGADNFQHLSTTKNYLSDIIQPMQLISRLTAAGSVFSHVKQTTQFVVGASKENDREIIKTSWNLYKRLGLSRIYFSAYQRGAGASELPGECSKGSNESLLMREHRLYQVDWLIRNYGFTADEIPLETDGNLSLECDPKEMWARRHPEFFPVYVNQDEKCRLLRVPGFGQLTVDRILELRSKGIKIRSFDTLSNITRFTKKAQQFVAF